MGSSLIKTSPKIIPGDGLKSKSITAKNSPVKIPVVHSAITNLLTATVASLCCGKNATIT